ncbi:hypothetical protein R9C00_11825 [Flammeovirgaceae bacterium SG7u.111]|nr:hypothetical protein [Flammeovirgaceae bacterium SG7u.132]WPO38141.1 hypothetical protein R9C00_11825 [Flammeovirgaceae bacterium SG7u.111]
MDELTKEGFSRLEYLIIFFSILYGYVTISFINHLAELLKKHTQLKFHFVPLAWIFLFFGLLFSSWYSRWGMIDISLKGFHHFIVLTLPVLIMTVISSLLSPPIPKQGETIDMYGFFAKNRVMFFVSFSTYSSFELISGWIYDTIQEIRFCVLLFYTVLFVLGLLSKNKKYQTLIAAISAIVFILVFSILEKI